MEGRIFMSFWQILFLILFRLVRVRFVATRLARDLSPRNESSPVWHTFYKIYYRRWWRRRQITREKERERENIDYSWRFSRVKFNDASLFFVLCTFMYIICCDLDESLMSLSCVWSSYWTECIEDHCTLNLYAKCMSKISVNLKVDIQVFLFEYCIIII